MLSTLAQTYTTIFSYVCMHVCKNDKKEQAKVCLKKQDRVTKGTLKYLRQGKIQIINTGHGYIHTSYKQKGS